MRTLFLFLLLATPISAAEIRVSAAASLTDVLRELGAIYERRTGDSILFNLGASSTLAQQIEFGAPVDLFLSADDDKMDRLSTKKLIDSESRITFLSNRLVIIVPNDSRVRLKSSKDLRNTTIRRIALAEPLTVPAGIYAKAHLQRAGLWKLLEPRVVPVQNVRAALAVTESGNVDAAFVYETDARSSKKVRVAVRVPSSEAPPIRYPFAMTTAAKNPAAAKRFLAFLTSTEARKIFIEYGFLVSPVATSR